jgi:glyoxylase-like metal-dependent hydrolase (beta-lactamase superfamily II)
VTTIETVSAPTVPVAEPLRIADDTYLIPNLVPAEPGTYVFVNSLVILAEEPVIIDTGAPLHRAQWLDAVSSVVDPADVRWIFLSHDDGDHLGNMHPILDRAPNATVVANFSTPATAASTCSGRRSSTGRPHVGSTTSGPV